MTELISGSKEEMNTKLLPYVQYMYIGTIKETAFLHE
jgi:hypothetical protein